MDISNVVLPKNVNPIFIPNPGSQTLALNCPAQQILYSGTRGCGKSILQLMRFRQTVGVGYGDFWKGIMIDRGYKNLDDLISKAKQFFGKMDDGSKFYSSKGDLKWVWRTGEELLFRSIENEDDYGKIHGQAYQMIGFNELTSYPDLSVYDLVSSVNRSGFVPSEHPLPDGTILPEVPMCIFSTTNPSGIGGLAVKKRFVDCGKNGEIVKEEVRIFNPRTQEEETIIKTKCHIMGSYMENRKLDPSYVADLQSIQDPILRRFWLLGDWSAVGADGGMFVDVFSKEHNVVEPFDIPPEWTIDRTFDQGDSSPNSILYFAESDGSDVRLRNGKTISTIKGDLFVIGEIYTCLDGYNNKGTRILPYDLAVDIVKYELSCGIYDRVKPGAADTAIFAQVMGNSVAGMMDKPIIIGDKVYPGVKWRRVEALKKPGSRKDGIKLIRERFLNAKVTKEKPYRDKPALFVFNTCKYYLEIMPYMMRDPRDQDDVSPHNDHVCDSQRYKLLSLALGSKSGKVIGLN